MTDRLGLVAEAKDDEMEQDQHIEAVIAVADVPRADFTVFAEEALRRLHDGRRFFWDEANRRLMYRGPADELHSVQLKA